MFADMTTWSGIDEYYNTNNKPFVVNGVPSGYLKAVKNLQLMSVRNAGHYVPRDAPEVALALFERFIDGSL